MTGKVHRGIFALVVAAALGACEGVPSLRPDAAPAADAAGASSRDVEAPEVFQAAESGLWDGRPSLGGVWVAHPEVADPERVMIRNPATGQFVVGALFRRQRDNPGPRIQVSSDAAAELGLLAGQPAELTVVALRREAVEADPEPGPQPQPQSEPQPEPEPDAGTAIAAAPAQTGGIDATVLPSRPRPQASLSASDLTAAMAATAPAAAPTPAATTPPAPPQATAPAASGALDRPWIQIGIFSVEANAKGTVASLQEAGVPAELRAQRSNDTPFWRVLAGPAPTEAARRAILDRARGLGFTDAFAVAN